MTSENVPAKTSSGRGLKIALMVSLAVNILIIGGVISTLLCFGGKGHRGRDGLMGFVQMLPADRAEVIGNQLKANREGLRALRKEQSEARGAARSALTAQPFDEAAFRAALDKSATLAYEEKKARLSTLADLAAQLTPEERQQLHEWFEERRHHFKHRGPRDDDDEESSSPPPQE